MEGRAEILLVEDQEDTIAEIESGLQAAGLDMKVVRTAEDALRAAKHGEFDMAIVSLDLASDVASDLVAALCEADSGMPIIVTAAPTDTGKIADAIQHGAHNWVPKMVDIDKLKGAIDGVVAKKGLLVAPLSLDGGLREEPGLKLIVGDAFAAIEQVVASDVPVLIRGETGTAKELVAKAIHYRGARRKHPFFAVNCAGIPEAMLQSELFGHEPGVFEGAAAARKGKVELAHTGALSLDNVDEIPPATQARLLRTLDEGTSERMGGDDALPADVRILAATTKNMPDLVSQGDFSEELYYRLAVYPISLKPLRERADDVPRLAQYFLERYSSMADHKAKTIAPSALEQLRAYKWPGNVRQLQNAIRRAILLAPGGELLPEHFDLPDDEDAAAFAADSSLANERSALVAALQRGEVRPLHDVEGILIRQALDLTNGNVTEAADKLGISRSTIYRKMQEHGVSL